ncbi:MAG TPA: hypothetical protein V6D19_09960 [Stenomitos sp.]
MVSRLRWILMIGVCSLGLWGVPTALLQAEPLSGETLVLGASNSRGNIEVKGYARGTVALFKTLGERDVARKRCMGYGSLTPDHVVEVQQTISRLTLRARVRSQDSTLIVEGPNNRLYCADDAPDGTKDPVLTLNNVKPGTYKVWIGAFEPGAGFRYSLTVQAE